MSGRLVCYVYLTDDEGVVNAFGPDDEVPSWAVAKITNPDVWASDDDDSSLPDEPDDEVLDPNDDPTEPPRGGPGSGRERWAAWATSLGIEVTDDMAKADIIAAVDALSA